MWLIGVEVEQQTSAPPPKKNPGSAPVIDGGTSNNFNILPTSKELYWIIPNSFRKPFFQFITNSLFAILFLLQIRAEIWCS